MILMGREQVCIKCSPQVLVPLQCGNKIYTQNTTTYNGSGKS
jgi:hypothetical protein